MTLKCNQMEIIIVVIDDEDDDLYASSSSIFFATFNKLRLGVRSQLHF